MTRIIFLLISLVLFSDKIWATTQLERNYKSPLTFTAEVNNYLRQDKLQPIEKHGIVITGSSSIRFWQPNIHNDFTQVEIIARGFGGSNMNDLLYFSEALITQYKPRAVAIYEGDNDIAQGISPELILKKFIALNNKIRLLLPDIRIYFISIKPSIARQSMWSKMVETNQLIQGVCNTLQNCTYIDAASKLLKNGLPKQDVFIRDGLHLNKKGYKLWSEAVVGVIEANEAHKGK
ncbi:MAG: GDSL-type esterase/lipase family protein [Colwellia sp.]|nr:GDSL-type esterase/lipase family protein [Colwellia sp.]